MRYLRIINLALSTRIIEGEDVDITEVPCQVSLQHVNGTHFCGGSILTNKWVLTAGHCMDSDPSPIDKHVVIGMSKLSEGGVIHTMKRSIQHPRYYTVVGYSHDMTLVELDKPIVFNDRAQPVRIPSDEETPPFGEYCTVQGWGRLAELGDLSDQLQKTTLPLWNPKECQKYWGYPMDFDGPDAPFMCAAWKDAVPNTCHGDSGGVLTYNGVQYGIVSFGVKCITPSYPQIYTHVYNLRDFIYNYTNIEIL